MASSLLVLCALVAGAFAGELLGYDGVGRVGYGRGVVYGKDFGLGYNGYAGPFGGLYGKSFEGLNYPAPIYKPRGTGAPVRFAGRVGFPFGKGTDVPFGKRFNFAGKGLGLGAPLAAPLAKGFPFGVAAPLAKGVASYPVTAPLAKGAAVPVAVPLAKGVAVPVVSNGVVASPAGVASPFSKGVGVAAPFGKAVVGVAAPLSTGIAAGKGVVGVATPLGKVVGVATPVKRGVAVPVSATYPYGYAAPIY